MNTENKIEDKIKELLKIENCIVEFDYAGITNVGYLVNYNNTKEGLVVYISDSKNRRDEFNTNGYFIDKIQSISLLERSDNSDYSKCSNCKDYYNDIKDGINYCPHCGSSLKKHFA